MQSSSGEKKSSGKPFSFTFHLYWSPDQNVPVLNPQLAAKVSSFFIRLRPTEPGDVRPAFPYDIAVIREAIYNEFQDWKVADLLIPPGSLVILNKVPGYPDEADEVFVNGELIGHRWYDPLTGRWRFRPIMHGAARMLEQKVGYYAIVDLPKLTRGYEIHRDRIVSGELPPRKGMLVVVQTADGRWQGLAKLVRSKRLYVLKAWRSVKPHYIETRATLRDVLEVNREEIERVSEKAKRFLKKLEEKHRGVRKLIVSYSGGKDSLVVLDLAREVLKDFEVIFNDTTLELPDTYRNVHEVANKFGVCIHCARAIADFTQIVKQYAPPARDFRYCCKMLKLAPISNLLKKLAPTGSVSIVGQRKYESSLRARLPAVAQSRWVANTIVAAPINDWTSLHVWLYILEHDLPYNKAYEKGFDRIGCWVCPANEIAEIELAKHWYPELYHWWSSLLEEMRRELDLPDLWTRLGLWRWRDKYPGDMRRFIELNVKNADPNSILETYRARAKLIDVEIRDATYVTLYRVRKSLDDFAESLSSLMYTLEEVEKFSVAKLTQTTYRCAVRFRTGLRVDLKIEQSDASVNLRFDAVLDKEQLVKILRVVARSAYCTRCGLCLTWCSTGAVKFTRSGVAVDTSRCRRCNTCNIACPAAEYLVMRSGLLAKIEVKSHQTAA